MSDKTVIEPVQVPGMQITFQAPIGPAGKGVSFVLGVDALIPQGALDERLDIIAAAARRQDAFEQLEMDEQSLAANRKLLAKAKAALEAATVARDAKVAAYSNARRRPVDATAAAPMDINAVSQHQQRIIEIEGQIAGCEERIPRWKAIIAGRDPGPVAVVPALAAE